MYHRTHTQIRGGFFSFFFLGDWILCWKEQIWSIAKQNKKKGKTFACGSKCGSTVHGNSVVPPGLGSTIKSVFFSFFLLERKKNWKTWQANDDNDEKGDFFKMRFGSCRCIFFDFLEGLYEFPSNWDKHQTMESKSWACWYGETTYCVVSLYNLTQIDSRVLCGYDVDNMSNTHYRHVESRGKIQFKD